MWITLKQMWIREKEMSVVGVQLLAVERCHCSMLTNVTLVDNDDDVERDFFFFFCEIDDR